MTYDHWHGRSHLISQVGDLLPEHWRWRSLRLPLADGGFAGGPDALGQAALREPEPTTKSPQLPVVVVRDRRPGSRTDLLPGEAAVVQSHESLGGRGRGQTPRMAKHGLHREVRVESAGPDGGLQRADVDVELLGQLVERQSLLLSL